MSSIVLAGCNHASAPAPLLERLSVAPTAVNALVRDVASDGGEALVLSTCHRTELYCVAGHPASGPDRLVRILARLAGTTEAEIGAHAFVRVGRDAVEHALRVASGLESVVLGEDQILSQWKRALATASEAGALGPVLHRLGAAALACGKRVRTETGIGRHAISLESLAVRSVSGALEGLGRRRLLVIGTGESAELVVRHLVASGAEAALVTVVGRTSSRAEAFAAEHGVRASDGTLTQELAQADAVICCASAPHAIVLAGHFVERTRTGVLPCVDLGMPRNVDESVRALVGVRLMTLADLAAVAEVHRETRRRYVPAAAAIVSEHARVFASWLDARGMGASVGRLQAHARRIAEEEVAAALARLGPLDERQRRIVERMARRIAGRLMHAPSVRVKEHPEGKNIAQAIEYAFGLPGATRAPLQRANGAATSDILEDIA